MMSLDISAQPRSSTHPTLETLRRHVTGTFSDIVVDLAGSHDCWLADERGGRRYLDVAGYYASAPLGHNHPDLVGPANVFTDELLVAAAGKPANPDFATLIQARFVETFLRVLGDPELPHLFFIDGGALAVENALKVAFDWKTRRNGAHGRAVAGWRVLHLRHAFHGRSGYTMSLTNTDATKTWAFPTFEWPRIPSPAVNDTDLWPVPDLLPVEEQAVAAAEAAFRRHPDEIACFIAEPVQCEGGDRHLRRQFLVAMQDLCHRHDALFILDEVQTGCGVTGRPWAYQGLGLTPDVVAFGKKTQVCGVMGGRRVNEVPDNALRLPGRLSSTWGGTLVDMLRATRILQIIEADNLIGNAGFAGGHLLERLRAYAARYPDLVTAPRGLGLLCCVDITDGSTRDRIVDVARDRHELLVLGCGPRGLRMRPPLSVTVEQLDEAVSRLDAATCEVVGG